MADLQGAEGVDLGLGYTMNFTGMLENWQNEG